jgi:hypothetical protein
VRMMRVQQLSTMTTPFNACSIYKPPYKGS